MWPDLDAELSKISKAEQEALPTQRSLDAMVEELLDIARADARRRNEMDPLKEMLVDLMPFLHQALADARSHALTSVPVSRTQAPSRDEASPRNLLGIRKVYTSRQSASNPPSADWYGDLTPTLEDETNPPSGE